ncbi:MAG TPA: hypothetical protein VHZ55_05545 [Bryobacteraceae bacterium]|nr:hypothetical protein [Bryobacteraceae bacterium]
MNLNSALRFLILGLAAALTLFSAIISGPNTQAGQILEGVRAKAVQQLLRSSNYACVETVDRSYYQNLSPVRAACETSNPADSPEIMHDRLRLNVAVSEGGEIFGWHGADSLSSGQVDRLVPGGPVSSGSFIGFVRNIFMSSGVEFRYKGTGREHGLKVVQFSYRVPQSVSHFRIEGADNRRAVVAFYGTFSANETSFELARLRVVAASIPLGLQICAADNQVTYQLAKISGAMTLIPKSFELHVQDQSRLYTVSRSNFSDCHEYRAESTLRFDSPGIASAPASRNAPERWLPPGLELHVGMSNALDEKTSFTGDAVDAYLTQPLRAAQGQILAPQNAKLGGIITQFENYYQPKLYETLRIQFNSLESPSVNYRMLAVHKASQKEIEFAAMLHDGAVPPDIQSDLLKGTIFFSSFRSRLRKAFQGIWETRPTGAEKTEISR